MRVHLETEPEPVATSVAMLVCVTMVCVCGYEERGRQATRTAQVRRGQPASTNTSSDCSKGRMVPDPRMSHVASSADARVDGSQI